MRTDLNAHRPQEPDGLLYSKKNVIYRNFNADQPDYFDQICLTNYQTTKFLTGPN